MKAEIFLGGTCENSIWRDELIPQLTKSYFNPVVPDWNEEAYQNELKARKECSICLYCITPEMEGVYSIAEVVDDSNKRPEKTVFFIIEEDCGKKFTTHQMKSLLKVGEMVEKNGGKFIKHGADLVSFLNK